MSVNMDLEYLAVKSNVSLSLEPLFLTLPFFCSTKRLQPLTRCQNTWYRKH